MTRRHWIILAVLLMAEVVSALESGMVVAGMARWVQIYGDPVAVSWLISAYLIVQAAAAVFGGRLGDMFGRRRVMIWCLAICAGGSVLSGLAPSLEWMIVGRAIQGAAGGIQPLCYGLIREHLPENRMRFGISAIVATAAGSSAIGMVIGGWLTDMHGPQTIFLAMSITATIALLGVLFKLPRQTEASLPQKLDWLGGVLFVPGTILLLLGVSNLEHGAFGQEVLVPGGAGIAILIAWVLWELRQDEPLINVRMLVQRDILLANTAMVFTGLSLMQATLALSMILQQPTWTGIGLGQSATVFAVLNFPSMIASMLASLATGWLADRIGIRSPMIVGAAIGLASIFTAMVWHDSALGLALILFVVHIGVLVVYTAIPIVVASVAPRDRISEATGFIGVLRALSRAAGTQIMGVLLTTSTIAVAGQKPLPDKDAFMLVFWTMSICAALALVAAFFLSDAQRKPRSAD